MRLAWSIFLVTLCNCLPRLNLIADNLLRSETEAVASEPSASSRLKLKHSGKVVVMIGRRDVVPRLEFKPIYQSKTKGGQVKKSKMENSLKS